MRAFYDKASIRFATLSSSALSPVLLPELATAAPVPPEELATVVAAWF